MDVMSSMGLRSKIEFSLTSSAPHLSGCQSSPIPLQLQADLGSQRGFDLPHGRTLHLNAQRPGGLLPSACGLLCSVAIRRGADVEYHGICRIGGVL